MQPAHSTAHRTDIDGLRAIAVLSVVFNHADFTLFSGGFTGVDIFFVISGFLITQIITRGVGSGSFSLVDFYLRRIRRIAPALTVVVLLSVIAGYFTMLPDSFENLAQSAVATTLFANNFLLSITSGYWDIASEFKPLLHTWSLGVEEQFYILFPIVSVVCLRFGQKAFVSFLVVGLAVSLALSVTLTAIYPTQSFYLIHTRAWELLLGAIGAHLASRRSPAGIGARALPVIGLALVLGSILIINKSTPYPSGFALLPCIGTLLILVFTQPGSLVHRLLSFGPLAFVGTISYSVYLWHQPLFAYARVLSVSEPPLWLMAGLTVLVLALGYLSWRFVEQPFRDRKKFGDRVVVAGFVASSALLLLVGLGIYRLSGLPDRVPGFGLGMGRYIAFNESAFSYKRDSFGDEHKRHVLVVGNSTARDLINIMLASKRFQDDEIVYRDDINICDTDLVSPLRELVTSADAIVIAANWTFDLKCASVQFITNNEGQKPVILVGPKHFGYNLDGYIHVPAGIRPSVRATLLPDTIESNSKYSTVVPADAYVDLLGLMNARFDGVPVFDAEGRILSVDRVHLTEAGAQFFAAFVFESPAWGAVLGTALAGAQ